MKLTWLFRSKGVAAKVEVGSRVAFRGLNEMVHGVVKKIVDGKALIYAYYMNSCFSQWVDINRLTIVS